MNARFPALIGIVGLLVAGCSGGGGRSNSGTSTATAASSPEVTASATSGKEIFTADCAQCHGATGTEGGVGPSLKNEKARKNFAQAVAWIKNPSPPMPKLYPLPLSDKDVNDVAAYVESL